MKKLFNIILLSCFVLGMGSCAKQELMTYEGKNLLLFTYSTQDKENLDSLNFSFAFLPDEIVDTTINLSVKLVGKFLDSPQPFRITVNTSESTGIENKDFSISKDHNFPDSTNIYNIKLKLNRPAVEKPNYTVRVELLPNEYFTNDIYNHLGNIDSVGRSLKFYVSNELSAPSTWYNKETGSYYLGDFSRKKLFLISKLYIEYSGDPYFSPRELWDLIGWYWYYDEDFGTLLFYYLEDQKNKGTPVLEADGSLMQVGEYFQ